MYAHNLRNARSKKITRPIPEPIKKEIPPPHYRQIANAEYSGYQNVSFFCPNVASVLDRLLLTFECSLAIRILSHRRHFCAYFGPL